MTDKFHIPGVSKKDLHTAREALDLLYAKIAKAMERAMKTGDDANANIFFNISQEIEVAAQHVGDLQCYWNKQHIPPRWKSQPTTP